ncbi:Uncharacterized protein dnm_014230 [Desulfonema magnum]|uniref:Uncharacterized protein n=1 Tax=Desulfonema magnum TaxID=45655 RepID=A0A975BGP7_9BACT|nr:Uncharacterized protein dnm_014230 [Desulfonema magnum]
MKKIKACKKIILPLSLYSADIFNKNVIILSLFLFILSACSDHYCQNRNKT